MRTSVEIPDPLMRRAKRLAQRRKTTLRELVLEGLRVVVDRDVRPPSYELEDCSYGSGGLVAGLSWEDQERMDELVYGDRG